MNRILKISFLLITIILINACKKEVNLSNQNLAENLRNDSLLMTLNITPYKSVFFNAEADTIAKSWPMYNNLKDEIERLKTYTIQDVISNAETVERVVDSLQKTIPKAIDTFPVNARIKVMDTKAKFLLILSNKQKPNLQKIKAIAEEYPLEFNALSVQINEVFIKLPTFE